MIPRYSRPEMVDVWEPQTRFRIWFEIEAHACDALAQIGAIPLASAKAIWEKAGGVTFDVARIDEIAASDAGTLANLPQGTLGHGAFVNAVQDFYLTNPIARASAVMAECSALAKGRLQQAAE